MTQKTSIAKMNASILYHVMFSIDSIKGKLDFQLYISSMKRFREKSYKIIHIKPKQFVVLLYKQYSFRYLKWFQKDSYFKKVTPLLAQMTVRVHTSSINKLTICTSVRKMGIAKPIKFMGFFVNEWICVEKKSQHTTFVSVMCVA